MKKLSVLYDGRCGLCCWLRNWAVHQPAFLELDFVPAGSAAALKCFPELIGTGKPEELIVISDEGGVYRDSAAWIMCLYALENYRDWSYRLSRPALFPLARKSFQYLSKNREKFSRWLGLGDDQLLEAIDAEEIHSSCTIKLPPKLYTCPYCKDLVSEIIGFRCLDCASTHHPDCWASNNHQCAIFGCKSKSYARNLKS